MSAARYDGVASWYDERLATPFAATARMLLGRLLGSGSGRCLDLCCGTGTHLAMLSELGWQVTGLDISADQLRLARRRAPGAHLVHADAMRIPFPDGHFTAVVSLLSHTDVDDFALVLREAARVLEVGGVLVYVGLHPCFVGPHSHVREEDGVPRLFEGYARHGRRDTGPGVSPEGLWARVGGVHMPLGALVQAVLDAPLTLELFEESWDDDEEYPRRIALRARRTA